MYYEYTTQPGHSTQRMHGFRLRYKNADTSDCYSMGSNIFKGTNLVIYSY